MGGKKEKARTNLEFIRTQIANSNFLPNAHLDAIEHVAKELAIVDAEEVCEFCGAAASLLESGRVRCGRWQGERGCDGHDRGACGKGAAATQGR